MTLEPARSDPGLWVNPSRTRDTPGAFAVVIGVSRYSYLDGTAGSMKLTSLEVSALTAYRFLQWLAADYHVDGCDIARCYLLLSPTMQELALEPDLMACALHADWANCDRVIRRWREDMATLPQQAARASRGLFFFSGHGIEKNLNLQLLLPADYLEPPSPNLNRAISTSNLANGLATLKVPLQMFFIDGCRNAPAQLRDKTIVGTPILNETANTIATVPEEDVINPDYVAPMLLGTSSGQAAFQPRSPVRGLSLFGDALLAGLAGQPDIELSRSETRSRVKLYPLQEFTEARVLSQLAVQRVRLAGGQIRNEVVTELPVQAEQRPPDAPGLRRAAPPAPVDLLHALEGGPAAIGTPSPMTVHATPDAAVAALRESGRAHQVFGSEHATGIWMQNLGLVAASTDTSVEAPSAVVIHQVSYDQPVSQWDVQLSIAHDDPIGHWLTLRDGTGESWSTLLLRLDGRRPLYQVHFELAYADQGHPRPIVALESSVAAATGMDSDPLVLLWRAHRTRGAGRTLEVIRAMHQERSDALRRAPMAGVFAGLLALRYGDFDLAGTLVQQLAEWIAESPEEEGDAMTLQLSGDWAALMSGWLVRQGLDPSLAADVDAPNAPMRVGEALARVVLAGSLPRTTEGFFAAHRTLHRLYAGADALSARQRTLLHAAFARLEEAMPSLAGDGLFLTCANTSGDQAMTLFFSLQATSAEDDWQAGLMPPIVPLSSDLLNLWRGGYSGRNTLRRGDIVKGDG